MAPQVNVDPFISWRVKLLHLELKKMEWGGKGFSCTRLDSVHPSPSPPSKDEPAD